MRSAARTDVPIPTPPFYGSRIVKAIEVPKVAEYLNKVALYRGQWEFKRKKEQSKEEYQAWLNEHAEPKRRT